LQKESRPAQTVELPVHEEASLRAPPEEHPQPEKAPARSLAGPKQKDELPQQGRPAAELLELRRERTSAVAQVQPPQEEAQRPAQPPQQEQAQVARRGEPPAWQGQPPVGSAPPWLPLP
jgi:hypothetical protein